MTDPLFIDTDCISAFLWVDSESILAQLFPRRIVIPKEVYVELSHPGPNSIKSLKGQVDAMVNSHQACIEEIKVGTDTYDLYRKLITHPNPGHKIIGKGEAACLALAKEKNGIIASNNLKDISDYVDEYHLPHLTTGDIMKKAFDAGSINEIQGNMIWAQMIARRRKLGYSSFTEFLEHESSCAKEEEVKVA